MLELASPVGIPSACEQVALQGESVFFLTGSECAPDVDLQMLRRGAAVGLAW